MDSIGRPPKPAEKQQRNARVVRLNDFFDRALDEIADEDGIAPAAVARKFIQEGIRRRMKEKRSTCRDSGSVLIA